SSQGNSGNNNTPLGTGAGTFNADGLGDVAVIPLSPTDFAVTFQSQLANVNMAQMTVGTNALTGTAPAITPSTIYQGVGNEAETLNMTGSTSNNGTYVLAFEGVAVNGNMTYTFAQAPPQNQATA